MAESIGKTIDIERILADKMGARARRVPRFVVSWLKRIAHEDDVNGFLNDSAHLTGVPWLEACVQYLRMNLQVKGLENLPPNTDGKRYVFVSNHPLGGLDGIALGAIVGKRYNGKIKYLVNDLLMNLPGLAPLCVPINKTGSQGRDFPRMVEAAFASDDHILMFPAGLCSRKINGVVRDLPWRKTFVTKSVETKRDVIPVHFGGQNSERFYRIANFCKAIGLKFNVAMLFLADEMYRNSGKTFEVRIGKPISHTMFDKSKTPVQWAQEVYKRVYEL